MAEGKNTRDGLGRQQGKDYNRECRDGHHCRKNKVGKCRYKKHGEQQQPRDRLGRQQGKDYNRECRDGHHCRKNKVGKCRYKKHGEQQQPRQQQQQQQQQRQQPQQQQPQQRVKSKCDDHPAYAGDCNSQIVYVDAHQLFCTNCGDKQLSNSKFCSQCGNQMLSQ
jgi:hypothetical protein